MDPSRERTLQAAIGLMAAILFTVVSHLWAWYAIWGLALAALLPTWWLSRFIIGVAILAPFTLAAWWIDDLEQLPGTSPTIGMYAGGALWVFLTREPHNAPVPCAGKIGLNRWAARPVRATPLGGAQNEARHERQ